MIYSAYELSVIDSAEIKRAKQVVKGTSEIIDGDDEDFMFWEKWNRAYAYKTLGEYDKALSDFKDCVKIREKDLELIKNELEEFKNECMK